MKFLSFGMFDVAKGVDVSQATDKFWASRPPGVKMLADYVCEGLPFPGALPNTMVGISIIEAESNEALAALSYPLMLAGASVWNVPVLEMPEAGAAEVEKKARR